jgi:TetR/AcrR family transcriptional repressor of bet genes
MRSRSIRSIRRSELSRAAFEAVVLYGLRGTTLEKVGEIAGVSKGVVLHHFKDKGALLEAVFRRSNRLLSESVIALYRYAETPYERLWAIVGANFFEPIFNRRVCQAWVSLSAEVPHSALCQRVQTACNARIASNLRHELKHFLPPEEANIAAHVLGMLIDGIWVRAGLMREPKDSKSAIDEFEFVITRLLPNSPDEIAKHRAARKKIEYVARILLDSKAFKEMAMQI